MKFPLTIALVVSVIALAGDPGDKMIVTTPEGLNDKFYIVARDDIGGFEAGSNLMWQAEGALGVRVTLGRQF